MIIQRRRVAGLLAFEGTVLTDSQLLKPDESQLNSCLDNI